MVQELPSTTLVLAAWAAGGLLAMAGGLTYAEMGSMFPRSGGLYVFLSEAYGPVWGFLFGWACLLVILTGSVATVAVGFAEYFSYFFPSLGTDRRARHLRHAVGRLEHQRRAAGGRRIDRRHHRHQLRRRSQRQPGKHGADGGEGGAPSSRCRCWPSRTCASIRC